MNDFISLDELIDFLNIKCKAHICIYDASGIFNGALSLSTEKRIHSDEFCNLAKSTPKGASACLHCKERANRKAICTAEPFGGYCIYGLYEYAYPLTVNGKILGVLYIGSIIRNIEKTKTLLHKTCTITKAPELKMLSLTESYEIFDNKEYYEKIAILINSYISLIYNSFSAEQLAFKPCELIENIKKYLLSNSSSPITLSSLASMYYINEKYLGQLFIKNIGVTFHQYLNDIKLENASLLLEKTDMKIIDIAYESGYQTVTYFNRIFFKKYKTTPKNYRDSFRRSNF